MDTSKIKTNIIVPTDEELINDNKKEKRHLVWNNFWKISLLILVVVVMVRVPYAGSYVDGLIDYVFGMCKYVLYPVLIFILISLIFHLPTEKVIKSKRFLVIISVSMLFVSCLISGISDTIQYWTSTPSFVDIMKKYHSTWKQYFFIKMYDQGFVNTGFISGGILAVLTAYLFNRVSYIVLIVVAFIGIALCIFSIFNINYRSTKVGLKIRKWMIKKMGGTFNYDGFNELRDVKDNQNKFKKISKSEVILNAKTSDILPFDLLPQSDVTCFNENFKKAGNVQDKIREFFKKQGINATPSELNVYSTFSELCFDAKDDQTVNQIIEVGEDLAQAVKLENYNLSIRGHVVKFEIPISYFSKISLRSAMMLLPERPNDITAVFGLDKKSHPYTQDFRLLPTSLILGKKGSGSATLAVLMALSICYITSPENLELRVLSANSEATYNAFAKLPHTKGVVSDDISSCIKELNEIHNLINTRMGLIKSIDAYNIDQYNAAVKNPNDKLKHVLVLMSNFENIIKESFQNNKIVNNILVNGPKVGVHTILQSYHVGIEAMDESIFNACAQKYILKLETDSESEKIFGNERGCQLHANGDCLTFTKSTRDMLRIQICNINQAELAQDIDTIRTFYQVKEDDKPKQEKLDKLVKGLEKALEPETEQQENTEDQEVEKTPIETNDVKEEATQTTDEQLEPENKLELPPDSFTIEPKFEDSDVDVKTDDKVEEVKIEAPVEDKPVESLPDNLMIQPKFEDPDIDVKTDEKVEEVKSEELVEEKPAEIPSDNFMIQPKFEDSDSDADVKTDEKVEESEQPTNSVIKPVEISSAIIVNQPKFEETNDDTNIDVEQQNLITEENKVEDAPDEKPASVEESIAEQQSNETFEQKPQISELQNETSNETVQSDDNIDKNDDNLQKPVKFNPFTFEDKEDKNEDNKNEKE